MNKRIARNIVTLLATAFMLVTIAVMVIVDNRPNVYAKPAGMPANAPMWAVTPANSHGPIKGDVGALVPIVTAAVTADGRACRDTREWSNMDIQTVIEWASTPDTLTLKIEHSNDNANYVDGPQLAATVVANADYLNRYDTFGAFTCVSWDIANPSATNYANVKVLALPHK